MALEAFLNGQKPKQSQTDEQDATIRFNLDLKEPTDETTNEFSYVWLVQGEREKKEKRDPLDPFGDDDEGKLAAIARSFEEKYGSNKRKRVIREQDCVHIGMGYDTRDSFVDDSEAYEDFVPPHVDTCHGGFYINTGELEFKQTADSSDYELPIVKKIKPKIKKQPIHGTPTAIIASKKLKLAKQRSTLQKKKLSRLPSARVRPILPKTLATSFANQSKISQGSNSEGLTQTMTKEEMTPMAETTVEIGASVQLFSSPSKCSNDALQSNLSIENKEPHPIPSLPTDLSSGLLVVLQQLDECISKDQNKEGKLSNKAKGSYDHLLMEIESLCKSVNFKTRNAVYDYVAYRFGIARPSLLCRVKRIIKKKEAGTLGGPLHSLKQAIDEAMPAQLAQYEVDFQAYITSLASQVASDKDGDVGSKPSENVDESVLAAQENHSKLKKPRKKFQWTPETRQLLCEVVRLKVEAEQAVKGKVQNGAEIIEGFLEKDVKPLWPKGWMQRRILYKISENAHKSFTGGSTQGKKVQPAKKELSLKPSQGTPKKQLMLHEVATPQPKPATTCTSDTSQSPSAAALRLVVPALLKASQTSSSITTTTVTNHGLQVQSVPFKTESCPKLVTTASSPTLVKTVLSSGSSPKSSKTVSHPGSVSVVKPAISPVSILKKPIQSTTSPVSVLKKTTQPVSTGVQQQQQQHKTLASTITASLQPKIITTSKKTKLLSTQPNVGLSPSASQGSNLPSTTSTLVSAGVLTNSGRHLVPSAFSSSSQPVRNTKSLSFSLPSDALKKSSSQPVIHNEPMATRPVVRLPTTTSSVASTKPARLPTTTSSVASTKPAMCPPQEASPQHSVNVALPDTQSLLLSRIQSVLSHKSTTNTATIPLTGTKVSTPVSPIAGQAPVTSSQAQVGGSTSIVIPGISSSKVQPMKSNSSVPSTNASTSLGTPQIGLAHVVISRCMPSQSQLGLAHTSSVPSNVGSTLVPTQQVRLAHVSGSTPSSPVSLVPTYASVSGTTAVRGTPGQNYLAAIPRCSSSSSLLLQQPHAVLKQPQTTFHSTQVLTEHSYILKATTAPSTIRSRDNSRVLDPPHKS